MVRPLFQDWVLLKVNPVVAVAVGVKKGGLGFGASGEKAFRQAEVDTSTANKRPIIIQNRFIRAPQLNIPFHPCRVVSGGRHYSRNFQSLSQGPGSARIYRGDHPSGPKPN